MSKTVSEINEDGYYEEAAPVQRSSTRYSVTNCLAADFTDYAYTVIIENPDYGRMLFLDKELQSSSYDEKIYHETLVHPAMNCVAHIKNKRVLVIGGAEGATVREVLKWRNSISKIEWVDIDAKLVDVCKTHLRYIDGDLFNDELVSFYAVDIMKYLENIGGQIYDCIIIDLPDPDPDCLDCLYGSHFWSLINKVLIRENGVISTHTGPVEPGLGRQPGLDVIISGAQNIGIQSGVAYHTFIPSFQSEWGFWMSRNPRLECEFPEKCAVMNKSYQNTIFHWDSHWKIGESI
jgi:spermidine synthase